jgi:hypothetical protein
VQLAPGSSSWEADTVVRSPSQVIPRILWNPKIDCGIHKSPLFAPTLSHVHPIHTLNSFSLRFVLMLFYHLLLGLPSSLFPSGVPTQNLGLTVFVIYLVHARCLALSPPWSDNHNIWRRVQIAQFSPGFVKSSLGHKCTLCNFWETNLRPILLE